jgi:hypothetical protein
MTTILGFQGVLFRRNAEGVANLAVVSLHSRTESSNYVSYNRDGHKRDRAPFDGLAN